MSTTDLVRLDLLGPALAQATGDGRWCSLDATLIAGTLRTADRAQLDDIAFYEAFAHFKFAVIVQGIGARVAAGSMAGQDFGNLDQEVLKIAEKGLSRLEED